MKPGDMIVHSQPWAHLSYHVSSGIILSVAGSELKILWSDGAITTTFASALATSWRVIDVK